MNGDRYGDSEWILRVRDKQAKTPMQRVCIAA